MNKPKETVLILDPHNANRGTSRGQTLLSRSLSEYGAGRSILTDRNGVIIAGNKTYRAAEALDLPVRIVQTTGEELVVVQRTDLDLETDPAARELAYADNRIAQIDLDWDPVILQDDLDTGVNLDAFWTSDELATLLESAVVSEERVAPDEETAQPGLYLHFGKIKIPLTQEEAGDLTLQLLQYREDRGTYYGFVGAVLECSVATEGNAPCLTLITH